MAGHRRTRADLVEAAQRPTRLHRRRERMAQRYATAATSAARLEVAFDYLRGAAARRHPNQARVDELLEEFARELIGAGDRVLGWQTGERLTRATPRKETAA